ncbi:hypothetical protein J2X14_004136 [Pantoea alhagi]|uniref:hypothetical protein n=1 Tax=Mixta sp. BE291 TaxID=3158787 RepID=UPI002862EE76|nr:hypothetical protein [Pantoea alhagi]
MPNSEVKRRSADGSVGPPHARVGNCQASNKRRSLSESWGFFVSAVRQKRWTLSLPASVLCRKAALFAHIVPMHPAKSVLFYPVCVRARQKSKRFRHPIPVRPADTVCFVIILRAQLTGSGEFLSFMPLRSKETDIFLTCFQPDSSKKLLPLHKTSSLNTKHFLNITL